MADQATILPPASPPALPYPPGAVRRYWPVATLAILALNFAIFALEIRAGGSDDLQVLLNFGASYGPYIRRGEYWRLIMPMFLHSGWLHILGNSYALFLLGSILERVYGYARYVTIYVLAGVGGVVLSMTASKSVSVGASAAIFGIAGAMLVTGYVHRDAIPRRWGRSFGRGIIPFIVLVLYSGFKSHGTDNWGHVGGLVTGALMALLIPPPRHVTPDGEIAEPPSQRLIALPLAAVFFAMVAAAQHYRALRAMDRLLDQAEVFESSKQYDRELEALQQARSLVPRQEQPYEALGGYYLSQKKYDQAIPEFQQAIRLTEGDDHPRLELGLAYQLKGDPQKAQQVFESVLGKNPQTAQGREILAGNQVVLADLYAQQKLYGEAIRRYQEALRLEPHMPVAHNNLAWLYATCDDPKYRDPKAALDHAQLAVALTDGEQGDFLDTLAEAHFASGDYRQAVELQKKALAIEPQNTELQQHMARYRRAAGM